MTYDFEERFLSFASYVMIGDLLDTIFFVVRTPCMRLEFGNLPVLVI